MYHKTSCWEPEESSGSPFWGVVSSMRKLAAGKKSDSIASKIGNQLVPALLNQHFQSKAVLSEHFPPDIMSRTVKTAHIAGGDFEKVVD